MNSKEIEERVDEILLKQTRGEKLTDGEETILAFAYYAARGQRTVIRVDPQYRELPDPE
ncbi:MAG: hypothetical protein M3Q60_05425 [Actinomycetota bacterium]|jgi:wobble nucleotide-excising tRNase|nr:hypothetical protein [Actinomycetota bacterium]